MLKIAIIGKPNVGKSSLFNRLAKERDAITSDIAGTTRDTKKKILDIDGFPFEVVDTGGIDYSTPLYQKVAEMSLKAAAQADIILYMVDGKYPSDESDKKLFLELLKQNPHSTALVINKIDNDKEIERTWDFYSFGSEVIIPISVSHNRGIVKLRNWITSFVERDEDILVEDDEESLEDFIDEMEDEEEESPLPPEEVEEVDNTIRIGIIGRVNVGKSSLLNALLGEERSVVSDIAGTTIDPVDEMSEILDRPALFVDTAGIRRRGKIEGIERYALDRTKKVLERSDIALLVLDAKDGFVELDEKIAGLVDEFKLGCIIVLNKWDENYDDYKKVVAEVRRRFKFLEYAPIITASAKTGRNIGKLKAKIVEIFEHFTKRIPTSELNKVVEFAIQKHHIPSDQGKMVRIYYATQYDVRPPKISLVMNRPASLHFSYKRYLVNTLRDQFGFDGTPIIINARKRGERIEEDGEEGNE